MKRTAFRLLAISSAALIFSAAANGRTRPRYGDSVRAEMHTAVSDYEGAPDVLTDPVFETLVTIDDTGRLQPGLAVTWTSPNNGSRWEFTLRSGVQFHDGSPLTPMSAAKPLAQAGIPGCKVLTAPNAVVVDCESQKPDLPALLSRAKYSVYLSGADNQVFGTGPFKIDKREAGQFTLRANDDYWGGRPFADSLELTTGVDSRNQMTDFALERTDVIEITTDQLRRAQQERWRLDVSRPAETVLLVVNSTKPEIRDLRLRQALSLAIDRASIHNVIFQRQGEVASGLLPNWLTGYAFLFPATPDIAKARELLHEFGRVPQLTIGYDATNSTDKLIAERIALNMRDIGISMAAVPGTSSADLRIRHMSVISLDPPTALNSASETLGITSPAVSGTPEALYTNERAALQTYTAIPLVHVPKIAAIKDRVRNWSASPLGDWRFDYVWLAPRAREGRP